MSVSPAVVKDLRERTGAGMMDCKRALQETNGDFEKAVDWLRQKGLSAAANKAGRVAAEGLVHAYIHGEGRIGVLIEVNCETDFVARTEKFKAFVKELCMQIAATNPLCVGPDDFQPAVLEREKAVLVAKNKESGKPDHMIEKILEGQMKKFVSENCLLGQNFIKDTDKKISQVLSENIATIGENIIIRRFVRYELGEGIEKKKQDLAADVQAALKG